MKKITIIAPYAFGYTEHIVHALQTVEGVVAEIIYLDRPAFTYKNKLHRIQNSLYKLFFRKNLKKTFVHDRILSKIAASETQDMIFIIRPDVLDDATLGVIKRAARKFVAYYWDSTRRFPRKVDILSLFDKVYSYDKEDVERYNCTFLTNYIFHEALSSTVTDVDFFNISTNDYRLPILEKLTHYISQKGWSKKIMVYSGSEMEVEHVQLITTQKTVEEVSKLIEQCKIIVEIQRTEQIGLSFRIFEALGQRKKLITTNKDIVNYDFYHPQNIWVLDEANISIPDTFVSTPYVPIDDAILSKYRIDNWVQKVFELE